MSLKAVSLFSGAGGLDIGFENAGYEIVFANDINSDSAQTWQANHPGRETVMRCGNILEQIDSFKPNGNVDVVIGGPPCQGFSIAGKMDIHDPRNKMVNVFLDIVELAKPKAFLMENVKALAISKRWESVRLSALSRAKAIGYDVELDVYCASDYGVSENRERMFMVGVRNGEGHASDFSMYLKDQQEQAPILRDVLRSVGKFGTPVNPDTCTAKVTIAKTPVRRRSAYSGMLVNGAGRPMRLDGYSQTLTASMGGNNTPIVDENALRDSRQTNWFETLKCRIEAGEDASTIIVPESVRRLTLKEAAAVQTFPNGYHFTGSYCSQYRQIGNAVPCRLAEHAAIAMRKAFFAD